MTRIGMTGFAGYYRFLATAIVGRTVAVHCPAGGPPFSFSDGESIFLPPTHDSGAASTWLYVVAQALMLASDSFSVHALRRLVGRPKAAQRYAYLEVRRALRTLETRVPHAFSSHPALLDELPRGAITNSAVQSAEYALALQRPLPTPPDFVGSVRPLAVLRSRFAREGLGALGRKSSSETMESEDDAPPEFEDDAESETSKILKLLQNPLMGKNAISELLQKILGAGRSRGDREHSPTAEGGSEIQVMQIERAWRRGINALRAKLPFDVPQFDVMTTPQFVYPEWDEFARSYRPAWVHVDEADPWRAEGPADMSGVLTPPSRALRRELASLGLDFEMHRRQNDGIELDQGRMIECAIDLRLGYSPGTSDIYRASKRTRRDLGVMVMVDLSGSTREKNERGESIIEHQLRAAWQLAHCFAHLGDRVALYGFQSWGRKLVRMVRLKGDEENWSGLVAQRCGLVEPVGYTRTGAAVRHGARVLQTTMRLPNRLLILITDGFSYDHDYQERYAEADSRRALMEAREKGTACVCLCIGGSTSALQLERVFGAASLLMIDDAAQMAGRMRKVCIEALRSVSRRLQRRQQAA